MVHTEKQAISSIPLKMLMVFFLFALNPLKAEAYSFTSDFQKGFYWQNLPVKMSKFVTNPSDGVLLEQLTNQAVADWENAVGKNLWDFSPVQTTSNFSGNYIKWSENFGAETGYDPTRTLAITIRYNQGTFFQQTVIILNGSISTLRQNWGNTLRTTILHEIGHTLGLDHSDQNAIMAPTISNLTVLQNDDIQGINALVDETIRRQSTGYVSPYSSGSSEKKSLVPACGTIEDKNNSGPGGGNAAVNFIGALLIGFISIVLIRKPRKETIFIKL